MEPPIEVFDPHFHIWDIRSPQGYADATTLFAPAGFAFAIWGVIYLGETIGMALLLSNAGGVADAVGPASRAWLCANTAQALWCLAKMLTCSCSSPHMSNRHLIRYFLTDS